MLEPKFFSLYSFGSIKMIINRSRLTGGCANFFNERLFPPPSPPKKNVYENLNVPRVLMIWFYVLYYCIVFFLFLKHTIWTRSMLSISIEKWTITNNWSIFIIYRLIWLRDFAGHQFNEDENYDFIFSIIVLFFLLLKKFLLNSVNVIDFNRKTK